MWAGSRVSLPYEFTLFSNKVQQMNMHAAVSLPYEFTLFSNSLDILNQDILVSLPYEFTLFSNQAFWFICADRFHYLMNLHYSQTTKRHCRQMRRFTTLWIYTILKHAMNDEVQRWVSLPYEFTLFSNCRQLWECHLWFHYLMNLHYSQTIKTFSFFLLSFHYLMNLHYSQT